MPPHGRHAWRTVTRRVGRARVAPLAAVVWCASTLSGTGTAARQSDAPAGASPHQALVAQYCVTCHNQRLRTAGLTLDDVDTARPERDAARWEKVIGKLRAGSMPPPGMPRPSPAALHAAAVAMENALDRAWAAAPTPAPLPAVTRLNRTQYNHAVRDLFGLNLDVRGQLPGDETADGSFDNLADALSISTAHLERYLSVARQVTRLATGLPPVSPTIERFEIPIHVLQDDRQSDDLPFGSRGGMAVRHVFPTSGEYVITVKLQRQYQDYLKGMGWPQQLDVRLDGKLLKRFVVGGSAKGRPAALSYAGDGEPGFAGDPEWEIYMQTGGDAGLDVRLRVSAGSHVVGVAFVRELWEAEGLVRPPQRGRTITNDNDYMGYANVGEVQIGGPFTRADGAPPRGGVFVCRPRTEATERACARQILSRAARLAYRRPVTPGDVDTLLAFFDSGRREGGHFDHGIQLALERMLVDPDFLLRVHRADTGRLDQVELAARLSFFLWSSIPDARLLDLAEQGRLADPPVLAREVQRMLADRRARALVTDFAAQWLNLRRLSEVVVDPDRYPTYDDSLLQAFARETELFVASTIDEDRAVSDLLTADYTFLNERLARHYGIPGIYGSRFRRVTLPDRRQRGGLLAHGALLATTSYPDRTSPVLRGKFILNNILGLPTPPPPPGVDTNLAETKPGTAVPSIRERLAQHRTNPSCASCHAVIDPLGFALENYDAIGAWRTADESGNPVDARGTAAGGMPIDGPDSLRTLLTGQAEQFPRTVTEKLLVFALGRPLEDRDRPVVRAIVRDGAAGGYRWSALILGIVKSPVFLPHGQSKTPDKRG
jgi:mono/diheme cytochrome c family protein